MRYLLLLVCLTVSMAAHAYNEAITSIAYNPSRTGAYDYLKVNFLSVKSGLFAAGNTTEINLYGTISITDERPDNHQYNAANADPSINLHEIKRIMSMSNYTFGSPTYYTFCTNGVSGQTWLYNSNACSGNNTLSPVILMGLGNPGLVNDWPTNAADSALIPNVYMYGGSISPSSGASSKYSWIKNIKSMYKSGSGSTAQLRLHDGLPYTLSFETQNLAKADSSTAIRVSNSLTLSGMLLDTSAFSNCTSRNNRYAWIERITDNHKKVKILACK